MGNADIGADQTKRYEEDQLVVDLPHLGEVLHELHQLGVKWEPGDADQNRVDEALGLALLDLVNVAEVAAVLRDDVDLVDCAALARRVAGLADALIPDLDLVMFALRSEFAGKYGGWVPTMGKNRYIYGVEGLPEIGGGGAGDPVPLSPEEARALSEAFTLSADTPWPGRRVRVGVLDTPLFVRPELQGRFLASAGTIIPPEPSLSSMMGHATFVAGLILRRAPQAELDVRWVLSPDNARATAWDVARMMAGFVNSGVDVLNMSFGCATADGKPPLVLARAVERLSPQIILVAAAGNHGDIQETPGGPDSAGAAHPLTARAPIWPAAFDEVAAVGAHDAEWVRAPFSPNLPWVDLMAPGVNCKSTYLEGSVDLLHGEESDPEEFPGFANWDGTSFAAANVSGEIAARVGMGQKTPEEVLDELLNPQSNHTEGDIRRFTLER